MHTDLNQLPNDERRLLRNCPLGDLACREIDEPEPQGGRPVTEATQDVGPMLRVVRLARVDIDEPFFEGPIAENRELACGGGDRLSLANYGKSRERDVGDDL